MRNIRIEKVTVNIGAGEAGEKLEKAKKMLEKLVNKKIVVTRTHSRTTFGTPKGKPIGVKVTLRGKEAEEFLKKALEARDKKLPPRVFDAQGNFSFGIKEHIDIPGVKYDPDIGILGMDVCVTLGRPGYRIERKSIPSKIGRTHRISQEETIKWISEKFGVEVGE
jgi:large subunit ribosomal protein L5